MFNMTGLSTVLYFIPTLQKSLQSGYKVVVISLFEILQPLKKGITERFEFYNYFFFIKYNKFYGFS